LETAKTSRSWKASRIRWDAPVTSKAPTPAPAGTVAIAGVTDDERRLPEYLHAYT
jgi:hypothetical protein